MNDLSLPDDQTLIIRRLLRVPRELAYAAWTTPEHMAQWMKPEPGIVLVSAFVDLRVGGRFRIQMQDADGDYFTAAGHYAEVDAPARLVYSWDWEIDGAGSEFGELEGKTSLITVEFREKGTETEFVFTHTRFASIESRDNHSRGWGNAFEHLANYLESGTLAKV